MLELCEAVQAVTGNTVELIWADQDYTGEKPKKDAKAHGIELQVIKPAGPKEGFVLLRRRWVVECGLAWAARFRWLSRDYERLPDVLGGLHVLVFTKLMLPKAIPLLMAAGSYHTLWYLPRGRTRGLSKDPYETASTFLPGAAVVA